jgi:hypothetical protein
MAVADFAELAADGYTGGYLQVLEFDSSNPDDDGAWVVQNLPIEGPQFMAGRYPSLSAACFLHRS